MRIFGFNINIKRELKSKSNLFGFNDVQYMLFKDMYGDLGVEVYKKIWVASRCVMMIAENVSTLPYQVEDSKGTIIEDDRFNQFMQKPNILDSGKSILNQLVSFYLLNGNGYIYRVDGVRYSDYWTLQSQGMDIIKGESFVEPIKGYKYSEDGQQRTFTTEDIIHIRSFNPNSRIEGIPRLTAASQETKFLTLTNAYQNALYKNQGTPSGGFKTDHILNEPEYNRLNKQIQRDYTGVMNAGKVMLLEKGLTYEKFSMSPTDLNLLKSEQVTQSAIATMYGVPVELLGDISSQKNYSNYKEARVSFYGDTIMPFGVMLSDMLTREFFLDTDRKVTINLSQIPELKPTSEELGKTNWISPNKKRALQGYIKSDDPLMDNIYLDVNQVEISDLNETEDNTEL